MFPAPIALLLATCLGRLCPIAAPVPTRARPSSATFAIEDPSPCTYSRSPINRGVSSRPSLARTAAKA
jgi:hypothetical protein